MKDIDRLSLVGVLENIIDDNWEEITHHIDEIPIVGDNTFFSMANAAASVLIAVSDAQDYLAREGMLFPDGCPGSKESVHKQSDTELVTAKDG